MKFPQFASGGRSTKQNCAEANPPSPEQASARFTLPSCRVEAFGED